MDVGQEVSIVSDNTPANCSIYYSKTDRMKRYVYDGKTWMTFDNVRLMEKYMDSLYD